MMVGVGLLAVGQTASQKNSVLVTATTTASSIQLSWPAFTGATGYQVFRKARTAQYFPGLPMASPGGSSTGYTDNSTSTGTLYEYKVVRNSSSGVGYGYILSGHQVPPEVWTGHVDHYMGKVIVLVESSISNGVNTALQQLLADLKADGWVTILHNNISSTASPSSIRSMIIADHAADPANVKAVLLVGHIPVAYSGNISQDGHFPDDGFYCGQGGGGCSGIHVGAWPCDGYYGELNGSWTDNTVNNTDGYQANKNVPGDGKFDQSDLPGSLELAVGRVDLNGMPAFTANETALTVSYLNNAHDFRTGAILPQRRSIIFDNLAHVEDWQAPGGTGENVPVAGSGWKSFSALVGAAVSSGGTAPTTGIWAPNASGTSFHQHINGQSFLWSYASGGGTFTDAANVGSTSIYSGSNFQFSAAFNMSMGSYFGDWNNPDNFLRAPLAKGALCNVWAGLPNWWFHGMGMGEPIGTSVRLSMSNLPDVPTYLPHTGGWSYIDPNAPEYFDTDHTAAMAFMGDPTLRMHYVLPPSSVLVSNIGGASVVTWDPSPDTDVNDYYVYRFDANGKPVVLGHAMVTGTSLNTGIPYSSSDQFMVRSTKLETTPSGSYWNLSLGVMATTGNVGGVILPVHVVLQGPYSTSTGLMAANLRSLPDFPLTEPYSSMGFTFLGGGGETTSTSVLNAASPNSVVDWVVVELRNANMPETIIESRCGLLQQDGDVVAPIDGKSPMFFAVPPGDYHVAVRHRNHFGCMTSIPVALSANTTPIDFASPSTLVFEVEGLNTVPEPGPRHNENGTMVLWAGNTSRDTKVSYTGPGSDRAVILAAVGGSIPTSVIAGYRIEDCDLSGTVKYTGMRNDRDIILMNIGGNTPTAVRKEHLPVP